MANGELVEAAADHIENVADSIEDVAEVTRQLDGRVIGFGLGGLGIGLGIGFVIGFKTQRKRLEKDANIVIEEMREFYRKKYESLATEVEVPVVPPKPPIDKLVKDLGYAQDATPTNYSAIEQEAINETAAREEAAREALVEGVEPHNVFEDSSVNDVWDYAAETKARTPDTPYVIHVDEFRTNEIGHDQFSYTYWENDDILCDPRDHPVEDIDAVVGLENLGKFGHGSGEPHVVYVRNERLGADFAINRSFGLFSEEVHGVIQHSHERMPRRRQHFDDS